MTMSNSNLAQRFAAGATKGEASNMYIEGGTIYSYGSHFPIAKRIPDGYLFNSDNYSPSTSQHKSHVFWALSGKEIWRAPNCEQTAVVTFQGEEIFKLLKKIPRARRFFEYYVNDLQIAITEACRVAGHFKLPIQPLYNIFATPEAGKAIKRMQKDNAIFPSLIELFGKSQFLGKKEPSYPYPS